MIIKNIVRRSAFDISLLMNSKLSLHYINFNDKLSNSKFESNVPICTHVLMSAYLCKFGSIFQDNLHFFKAT